MFYLIGLGLGDPKDVTIKGLEIIKNCDRVYLEHYTSILSCGQNALEQFYGRPLIEADRELVEQGASEILLGADESDVALLVVGDPFGATTHTDLILRARENGIEYKVIHNASIMNAVGCCGLQLYHFGETVSIPYWEDDWKPDSFYYKIKVNRVNGMHTLCLLDIKVKEPTMESLMKGKKDYQSPRFMSVSEAAKQLIEIIKNKQKERGLGRVGGGGGGEGAAAMEDNDNHLAFNRKTLIVGLARIGQDSQDICVKTLEEMCEIDMGAPLHSLVIPSKNLHPIEVEYLQQFSKKEINEENFSFE